MEIKETCTPEMEAQIEESLKLERRALILNAHAWYWRDRDEATWKAYRKVADCVIADAAAAGRRVRYNGEG